MNSTVTCGAQPCDGPDIAKALELTHKLDGYLNSPEQVALGDDLRAALDPRYRAITHGVASVSPAQSQARNGEPK